VVCLGKLCRLLEGQNGVYPTMAQLVYKRNRNPSHVRVSLDLFLLS
jgi:hypothetical protein